MKVTELPVGKDFTITAVLSNRETGKKLADMGFTRGAVGRIVRKSLFGGPLQIKVRGYDVSIRKSEAEAIIGELVGQP